MRQSLTAHVLIALALSYGLSISFWLAFGVFVLAGFILWSVVCAAVGVGIGYFLARNNFPVTVLATIGNNAPFVGLLGTVIGIIRAFQELDRSQGQVTSSLMSEVGEALVATAIGLLVALPAVAAFNALQRVITARLERAQSAADVALSYQPWALVSLPSSHTRSDGQENQEAHDETASRRERVANGQTDAIAAEAG